MNRINQFDPILPPAQVRRNNETSAKPQGSTSFQQVLQQQLTDNTVKFSNHCQKRLVQNNIQLDQLQLNKLNQAVDKAAGKGARESCVIMEDKVFIVNVPNRIVKTVVESQRMQDNVFTNIDSAVIV